MFIYYVYAYINKKTGLPYYIGKGKERRAYAPHGRIKVPKDISKIVFLETNLSNVGACALERRYISWYGRKIDNSGILLNIQEGGEGSPGLFKGKTYEEIYGDQKAKELKKSRAKSNSTRNVTWGKKISKKMKGKPGRKGISTSLKNKTYEEIYDEQKALEMKKIRSEKLKETIRIKKENGTYVNPMLGKKRPDLSERNKLNTKNKTMNNEILSF